MIIETNSAKIQGFIKGCLNGNRHSQKELYRTFYAYAFSICMRYSQNRDDAVEILNDGFLKVFGHISKYDQDINFKFWLRKIMIHTAIDAYRKAKRKPEEMELLETAQIADQFDIIDKLAAEDLVALIQELPKAYRTVFNLFAIDGFTHPEIAAMLNIDTGTSKSNLFKARALLKNRIACLEKLYTETAFSQKKI